MIAGTSFGLTSQNPVTSTLASDAFTASVGYHKVAAESGTADNLATINRDYANGDTTDLAFLIITADTGDTITVKNGTGNISCGSDITMSGDKHLILFWTGAKWVPLAST